MSVSFEPSLGSPAARSPQAILLSQVVTRDLKWLVGAASVYVLAVVLAVFTLHPYFSQTWDVTTFIGAGKIAFSSEWHALYEASRADNYWPYAYPPLHAFLVAPFVLFSNFAPAFLLTRVPPMLFDVALAVLLYLIVARKTENQNYARLAMLLWLLNPVTWYDTAVQGHFEAEWLFFVALAYFLAESPRTETKRGWILPTLFLSIAFLFKQNALLFALPLWAQMLFASDEKNPAPRLRLLVSSMALYALPIVLLSLPFLAYSNDYWYMNVQYVANVPLQTQSWLVALAALFGAENFLLRASSLLIFLAAALISFCAARRKMDLWLVATLIVLAFFLLSKKVVGYYYVMLLPFAIVALIPAKQFRLLSLLVVAIAFISLSPYFADWAKHAHWWAYAVLGIGNSILWLGIFIWLWRNHPLPNASAQNARAPAFLSLALFFAAFAAALLQPFINSQTSAIRAPLVPNGLETQTLFVLFGFLVLVTLAIVAAVFYSRTIARAPQISAGMYALVVLLAPLYFLTFTLTKESTAAFELLLTIFNL